MNRKSCSSDNLLSYLLKRIESFPEAKFYESDLTRISASEFAKLKKLKYLVFDQYDFEKESYFDKRGNERFVKKINVKWVAASTDDSELSPIYLKEQNLNRYSFAVQTFLTEIRTKNALVKNIDQISHRVYFIGEKIVLHDNVGVFVAFVGDDEQTEAELLGLKAKIGKIDKLLVLCPTYVITSQDLLGRLAGQNIACLTFKEAFNGKGYAIDFSKARFEAAISGSIALKLSAAQMADYTKHKYLCYDSLHIPGTGQLKRSNDLVVNDHRVKIPDTQFRLLIELVVGLKKGEGGWLTKDIKVGGYQGIDNLRKTIRGYLLEKDAKKFIENDGSKRYRISTHPTFVTYDRGNLLKHTDAAVRGFAKNC